MSDEPSGPIDPADPADLPTNLGPEEMAKKVAQEERASIPAIYVDTWTFLPWKGHVRMVLGEELYQGDYYRGAFVMELNDAERFARHLLRVIERRKARDTEIDKATLPENDP